MKFGRISSAESAGAVLAHGVAAVGLSFKKGRKLSAADAEALVAKGVMEVVAARLEAGDVPEDEAARRIAVALAGGNVEVATAFTGRSNLYAAKRGLVLIDAPRIHAINAIDESVTVATLAPYDIVDQRTMLATIKIIPFATREDFLHRAEAIAKAGPVISVAPFKPKRLALISTADAHTRSSVLDKTLSALRARADQLGAVVSAEERCAHEERALTQTLKRTLDGAHDIVLIFGASAITDRADVVPASLLAVGGRIDHFGMPVDPGNLLLLGEAQRKPVIGLPGCARSPKVNGFDWVLQRLVADVPVKPNDLMAMGVGGLLKEIPSRPQPREGRLATGPHAAQIAAVVLAAGKSSRMGAENKLLRTIKGVPMIARSVDAALGGGARPVVVVTGNNAAEVKAALGKREVSFAHNAHFADGMATSLSTGVGALPKDCDGALVCLGDMPAVTTAAIGKLIAAFNPAEGRAIVVPTFGGKRGNPVLFAREYFDDMAKLTGDGGAKAIIAENADTVYEVEMDDAGVLADADTPAAFTALEAQFQDD